MNVLFICSRNQWRSPTAERVFRDHPALAVRSAGTSPRAKRTVNAADIAWADAIVVMESQHQRRLREAFRDALGQRPIHVLDIPDEYRYMDPELIEILQQAVPDALGLAGS